MLVREVEDAVGCTPEDIPSRPTYLMYRTAIRLSCVAANTVTAAFVPYFPQFMELVGALCLSMIVFVLPVIFDWKLRSMNGEPISFWSKVVGPVIILVGLTGGTIGTVQAVRGIITATSNHGNQTGLELDGMDAFGPRALPASF